MFEIQFNKQHAIALRQHGFSASEISDYMNCSKSWLYNVVKQEVDTEKRKELMDYVVEQYNQRFNTEVMTCKECGVDFTKDNEYSSGEDFCSDTCHAKHVLDDATFKEIYGDK